MQGELREIDIRSILQLIEIGQRTGELLVEAYSPIGKSETGSNGFVHHVPGIQGAAHSNTYNRVSWFVFFTHGQIVYTADGRDNTRRLQDYLRRYEITDPSLTTLDKDNLTSSSSSIPYSTPEYSHLWSLLERNVLKPTQARSIVKGMIRETLFDLLGLHQGSFIFEMSPPLSPTLVNVECSTLVGHIMQRIQLWKQLHPQIQSPDQCPYIDNHQPLRQSLKPSSYNLLKQWAQGDISIRQIARYLNRDVVSVAKALYPYINQGIVHLSEMPGPLPSTLCSKPSIYEGHNSQALGNKVPRVVCIDDGIAFRHSIEAILQERGYEVFTLGNPLEALGKVFQLKPDLILCDIAMPELDGYEVCSMLRKSTAFRQTPIVMLTGKDGFIDRIKARMVGANDYLTKPFSGLELLTLVERYVGAVSLSAEQTILPESSTLADLISMD